jgi:hypothetical protein
VSARVLVIDENLNPRLARELRHRGRRSRTVEDLGLKSALDADLIRRVFALFDDPVLVTADDSMPAEHEEVLRSVDATIATLRPWTPTAADVGRWEGQDHRSEEEWLQEIVHRWAHAMQTQDRGTFRRYGPRSSAPWRAPRR